MKNSARKILSLLLSLCLLLSSIPNMTVAAAESSNTVIKLDNTRELPTQYGTNILSGKNTYKIEGYDTAFKEGLTATNREGLTDGYGKSLGKIWESKAILFASAGTPVIKHNDGSRYLDIIFRFDSYYDINAFCAISHHNPNLSPHSYKIFTSSKESELFSDGSLKAEVKNPDSTSRQVITFKNGAAPKQIKFIGIRVLYPVSTSYNATYDYYYTRFAEFAAFGGKSTEQSNDNTEPSGSNKTNSLTGNITPFIKWDCDKISGMIPLSVKYKSGAETTEVPSSGYTDHSKLTDNDNTTCWELSGFKFKDLENGTYDYTNKENYYVEILYDVGKSIDMQGFYICHHQKTALITAHYKVYAGNSTSFTENNLIADYYNENVLPEQYFVPKDNTSVKARYFAVRIYDPCSDYANEDILNGNSNYSNTRIAEIAVFSGMDLKASISFNKSYETVTHNNAVYFGPLAHGTKAVSLKNSFNGNGEIELFNADGRILNDGHDIRGSAFIKCYDANGGVKTAKFAVVGDLNFDGSTTVTDMVTFIGSLLTGDLPDSQALVSDTNNDGHHTVTDAVGIRQLVLGKYAKDPTSPDKSIQKTGHPTEGARSVSVDVNNIVNKGFKGFGTNVFPSTLSDLGKEKSGYNEVYFELDKKRLTSASPNVARMWFQIDWMVTDSGNATVDQNNYLNGIYDFNNSYMQAVFDYAQVLKDIDCEVEINFGWKTAERIEEWFNAPMPDRTYSDNENKYRLGVPKNTEAFGKAAAAFLKEMWHRGYSNVKYIAFYNEPNANDFEVASSYVKEIIPDVASGLEEEAYWSLLVKDVDAALTSAGIRKQVEIWGPEIAGMNTQKSYDWFSYQYNNSADYINCWSGHNYANDYRLAFNLFEKYLKNFGKKGLADGIMVTEMYGGSDSLRSSYPWNDWNNSTTGYIIAASNTGIRGVLAWSLVGGWLPHLSFVLSEAYDSAWLLPTTKDRVDGVNIKFYESSLLMNYIPRGSNVVHTAWDGDDIKATAYTFNDGNDMTIVVEANGSDGLALNGADFMPKDVKITINDTKFQKFNRFSYIRADQATDANCTVNMLDKEVSVENGCITDSYSGKYGFYIYTTLDPIKQISLEQVTLDTAAGGTVKIDAKALECGLSYELQYEVAAATNKKGSVTQNGWYTSPADAKTGDIAAIKVSLKDNPKVYAIALVYVT